MMKAESSNTTNHRFFPRITSHFKILHGNLINICEKYTWLVGKLNQFFFAFVTLFAHHIAELHFFLR